MQVYIKKLKVLENTLKVPTTPTRNVPNVLSLQESFLNPTTNLHVAIIVTTGFCPSFSHSALAGRQAVAVDPCDTHEVLHTSSFSVGAAHVA